ncbi:hypothetical protein [Melghirimyces profundicolus]|nr:hypothetical protein [Melghirimyces profundicolus]
MGKVVAVIGGRAKQVKGKDTYNMDVIHHLVQKAKWRCDRWRRW